MNLYAYCGNSPLSLTDPSGFDPFDSNDTNDSNDSGYYDPLKQFSAGEYTWWEFTDGTDAVPISEAPLTLEASKAVTWALEHEGDKSYGFWGKSGGTECHDFRRGSWKCNKFVHDAFTEANNDDPYFRYPTYLPDPVVEKPWPIRANHMASGDTGDPILDIMLKNDYPVITGGLKVGDIITFPSEGGSGHMGIYIGNGKIIQAGSSKVVITKITEREGYENMVVRRYQP